MFCFRKPEPKVNYAKIVAIVLGIIAGIGAAAFVIYKLGKKYLPCINCCDDECDYDECDEDCCCNDECACDAATCDVEETPDTAAADESVAK